MVLIIGTSNSFYFVLCVVAQMERDIEIYSFFNAEILKKEKRYGIMLNIEKGTMDGSNITDDNDDEQGRELSLRGGNAKDIRRS